MRRIRSDMEDQKTQVRQERRKRRYQMCVVAQWAIVDRVQIFLVTLISSIVSHIII